MNKLQLVIFHVMEDIIRNISGPLGLRIRGFYYKIRLKKCGKGLKISENVHIVGPEYMEFGDNVNIDKHVILIASAEREASNHIKYITNSYTQTIQGLTIGNNAHIAIRCMIQSIGGIRIGNDFTMSESSKIYSWSNDVSRSRLGTIRDRFYIKSPIVIKDNVWVGINASIFKGLIGKNVFIQPNSVVTSNIEENTMISGNPATKIGKRFV